MEKLRKHFKVGFRININYFYKTKIRVAYSYSSNVDLSGESVGYKSNNS